MCVNVIKNLTSVQLGRNDLDPNITDGFGRSAYYYALKVVTKSGFFYTRLQTQQQPELKGNWVLGKWL